MTQKALLREWATPTDKVILPFINHELSSKKGNEKEKTLNHSSLYSDDVRMFPREKYPEDTFIMGLLERAVPLSLFEYSLAHQRLG
jgi:hypothetical protein